MSKVYVSDHLNRIVDRALWTDGSLGDRATYRSSASTGMPAPARIYDGPSEVHRMVIARNVLKAAMSGGSTKSATGGLA